jgi:glycosyltransferase involved in cell wall biosynthesis
VAGYCDALARTGRLAAALLAPELPPPFGLPASLMIGDLVWWDSMAGLRSLVDEDGPLAYHVAAPFLHCGPGDPGALAVVPHWTEAGLPRVVTLYDLIPLRAPRHYLPTPDHEERYRARARWVADSDLVLAISEHTRSEALALLDCSPDKVVTIGAGVSPFFSPPDGTDDELFRFYLPHLEKQTFVLTVGGSDVRKATDRLITAVAQLDLHLLVVGDLTPAWRQQLCEVAAYAGLPADRLSMPGAIADDLLRACYRRATLTVMPSLAEGAGLPLLESAACGTPALASSTTALAEFAGTPLATFNPTDADNIADAIAKVLDDSTLRDEIIAVQAKLAATSTWDAVAARAVVALDRLTPAEAFRPRRRLAYVGPLPPDGGGIGVYSSRVLSSVDPAACDIDSVTAGPAIPSRPEGIGYVAASSFGHDRRVCSYDAVLYVIGNSAGHLPTVEMALRYPGWLWLHEVRLAALATTALESLDDSAFRVGMERLLRRAYPGRPPLAAAGKAGRSNLDLINAGVGLAGPLAERCCGILVNSELARRLLLLDLAPLAHHPTVYVLPPACPPVRPRPPAAEPELVVAFGVVSMSKRPDLLVDAAALAGCRLAFVGPCLPILAELIGDRARARGIAEQVEVVGAVEEPDWMRFMDRAALAVQLRDANTGETSAAVLEALSAGVPVLTNVGSAAELPVGTVAYLASSTASDVAGQVASLLEAPEARRSLSEAGQEFAAAHSFTNLAAALLSVVLGD